MGLQPLVLCNLIYAHVGGAGWGGGGGQGCPGDVWLAMCLPARPVLTADHQG